MDLRQMQYFLCVAQEGNITRAARRLNIVQPALSMQIAKLEKSLGKQLFYRMAQGMSLTPAGEVLVHLIDPIVKDVERARDAMAQLDGKVSGRVSIGMITSAAQSTLPISTSKIAVQYPEIRLLVCEGYTDTMLEWVLAGQLDIAIVNAPLRESSLATRHVLDEEMMIAYRAGRELTLPRVVPFPSLNKLELVIPSRRHGLRRILDDAAEEAGFSFAPRLEIDTLPAICEVVAATDLVTILPVMALHAPLAMGRIKARRLKPLVTRSIACVTNPRRIVSSAMSAVMDIISTDLRAATGPASRLGRK
jgi:LysR family transcriptional regulator, nitrogen assimilation regulatory protein